MAKQSQFAERVAEEAKGLRGVTVDDMVCRDCLFRRVDPYTCETFPKSKPDAVLASTAESSGEDVCFSYALDITGEGE